MTRGVTVPRRSELTPTSFASLTVFLPVYKHHVHQLFGTDHAGDAPLVYFRIGLDLQVQALPYNVKQ